ncbi:ABC transporter permease [Flavobacterium rhizosphaerae]|uniref:ABC transporter permease n=1 Tax=Flavobacterium rhizosphaerae TaxID=3163298 RepID=A0ABW8YU69_9FLAO
MSLSLIIKREFNARVRNKAFLVMTFLSPLLIVAMGALIGYLANLNNDEVSQVALYDASGLLKNDFKSGSHVKYTDLSGLPLDKAKEDAAKNYEGLIYIPQADSIQQLSDKVAYISNESPSLDFIGDIEDILDEKITQQNLVSLGFDPKKIEEANVKATIRLSKFSGEETNKEATLIRIIFGGGAGYLIMMFVIIYGNMVMRSVIEEKTNRIIEIIISSVKPFKLMMGKIIGTSLAGVLQFVIWAVLGLGLIFALSTVFGIQMGGAAGAAQEQANQSDAAIYVAELFKLPLLTMFISFIIFFIGGYFLYSSLYAAIGAAVDSETDSQQFLLPIIMPLMLGVYVGFFTVISDPNGTVATVFSMIPFTSPIVMLMRIPFGVPLWQIALSVAILFGTFFFVVWFASKIYRVGILMYGKKPTYQELFKWMRY